MKKILFPVLFILLTCSVYAQIYNQAYDITKQNSSKPSSMATDPDGSTVTVQTIGDQLFGIPNNAHLIKVDAQGQLLWSREYGSQGVDERANGICRTDDGGYIVVGVSYNEEWGNGTWMFRIDSNGNQVWSKWYGNLSNYISEGYMIARTSESDENYIVVGTSEYPRRICAFKIAHDGKLIWSHEYYDPNLVSSKNDFVNSMVEDPNRGGFIIAGTERDYYVDNEPTFRIFTFGIDLNGQIIEHFRRYEFECSNNETDVNITRKIDNSGFMLSFSAHTPDVQSGTYTLTAKLELGNNLKPVTTHLYANNNTLALVPNSIYVDPHGTYAISGTYNSISSNVPGFDADQNPFLLLVGQDGTPITFRRYNTNSLQECDFMAFDFTSLHENYILKTHFYENNSFQLGLIRTDLSGWTDCELESPINIYNCKASNTLQKYKKYAFATELDLPIDDWDLFPTEMDCSVINSDSDPDGYHINPNQNTGKEVTATNRDDHNLLVYPSKVDGTISEVMLEFQGTRAAEIAIMVYDVQGKLVYQAIQDVTAGRNTFTIPQVELALGLNTIVLTDQGQRVASARVLKL